MSSRQRLFALFLLITSGIALDCNKENEEYRCGSACHTECSTLGEMCPTINVQCFEDCYCIDGFAKDDGGNCIPIKDCP
ncbi:inducible metalloproteinase inhibitor protein-like [Pieris rapae]|uniref:inducible metalloproteinase inhibitor protein-like n=1 Tax=Pieris rapae TaxID=64459 RepID=UPI001E28198F|nr:inducible metalloproteinase inhibitor protein-like [Pieris rapae]